MKRGNVWEKLVALFLCSIMICSLSFAFMGKASADDNESEENVVDYVLIITCTSTSKSADADEIRQAAAQMFVDLLPVDNARVALFAVGNEGTWNGTAYVYSERESYRLRADDRFSTLPYTSEGGMPWDAWRMRTVYQLWDFDDSIKSKADRDELKEEIIKAFSLVPGNFSDTHLAVYAAIDALKANALKTNHSKKACILLISDENLASYQGYKTVVDGKAVELTDVDKNRTIWTDVQDDIKYYNRKLECNWVLNWIDLGSAANAKSGNTVPEDHPITQSCNGETIKNTDIQNLPKEIASVIAAFASGKKSEELPQHLEPDGKLRIDLSEFGLLTEANAVVTGDGIKEISIKDPDGNIITEKDADPDVFWFSHPKKPNSTESYYTAVKIVRPQDGQWSILVEHDSNQEVFCQEIETLQPDISFTCTADPGTNNPVNEEIIFTAEFTYGGKRLNCSNAAYEKCKPELYYTHTSTGDQRFKIDDVRVGDKQYNADFKLEKSGVYTFYFRVKINSETDYRDAEPIRNISVNNELPTIIKQIEVKESYAVGAKDVPIADLKDHFEDKEGEKLDYIITCKKENGIESMETIWDVKEDKLIVNVPKQAGKYVFEIYAEERVNKGRTLLPLSFTLNAVNTPTKVLVESPCKKDMILNAPDALVSLGFLPKDKSRDYVIKASDLFVDPDDKYPDDPTLMYTFGNNDRNEDDQEITSVSFDEKENTWTVKANSKGKATVTFFATDPSNEVKEVTYIFTVKSVGAVLGERYWWIPVLIALIILVIAALLASKRVRGRWVVQVDDLQSGGSCTHSFTSLSASRDSKLKKTKVSLLSIVKCAVRLEDAYDSVDFTKLPEKVVVLQGTLTQGRSIKFAYSPVGYVAVTNADVRLEKSGKYVLKRNDELVVVCEDEAGAKVLQVTATFR